MQLLACQSLDYIFIYIIFSCWFVTGGRGKRPFVGEWPTVQQRALYFRSSLSLAVWIAPLSDSIQLLYHRPINKSNQRKRGISPSVFLHWTIHPRLRITRAAGSSACVDPQVQDLQPTSINNSEMQIHYCGAGIWARGHEACRGRVVGVCRRAVVGPWREICRAIIWGKPVKSLSFCLA